MAIRVLASLVACGAVIYAITRGSPRSVFAVGNTRPIPAVTAAIRVAESIGPEIPGALPGWRRAFADDFTENVPLGDFPGPLADRWAVYPQGWRDTAGVGLYSPLRTISVHDRTMDFYLHQESGTPLIATAIPRLTTRTYITGQLYGVYALRFRAPPVPGYKLALLLWPDSERWPQDGEIDFPEGDLVSRFCGFVHHQGAVDPLDFADVCSPVGFGGWHTAVIVWTRLVVAFALDGHLVGTVTDRIPDTPMHFLLQTETTTDQRPLRTSVPAHVQFHWVAIYAPQTDR